MLLGGLNTAIKIGKKPNNNNWYQIGIEIMPGNSCVEVWKEFRVPNSPAKRKSDTRGMGESNGCSAGRQAIILLRPWQV